MSVNLYVENQTWSYTRIQQTLSHEVITQDMIDEAQAIFDQATKHRLWKRKSDSELLRALGTSVKTYQEITTDWRSEARRLIDRAKATFVSQSSPKSAIKFLKEEISTR